MATPQRKMVKLNVEETSGVDHPAHLHEGWIVTKAANRTQVDGLFGSVNTHQEEAPVADNVNKAEEGTAEGTAPDAGTPVETVPKADYDALVVERDALAAAAAASGAPGDGEGESAEKALEKALEGLPAAVRDMLKSQQAQAEADRAAFQKERDARLDSDAITKSKETFKSLGLEHTTVAPALRRVALINEDLAKSVETALKAADEQLKTANLFSTVGKSTTAGEGDGAYAQLTAKAQEILKSGEAPTLPTAFAKAVERNPHLYTAYRTEQGN